MATTSTKRERNKLLTPVFRLSFPNLFEARAVEEGGKKKFGCSAIWTPSKFTAREKELWKAIMDELNKESMRVFNKPWKDLNPDIYKKGIRDGAAKEGMEGYGEGTRFASLTSNKRPGVVDKDRNPISPEEGNADEIYPGCYCRATVSVYSFANKGKGVALGLRNIQKVKDGPRLDNHTPPEEDFEDDIEADWLDQDDTTDTDDSF